MILGKLAEILGRKKLKVSHVAKDTGISRNTLSGLYYNKSKGFNFDNLNTLCKYLNITPNELFVFYDVDIKNIEINNSANITGQIMFDGYIEFEQLSLGKINLSGCAQKIQTKDLYNLSIQLACEKSFWENIGDESLSAYITDRLVESIGAAIEESDLNFKSVGFVSVNYNIG